MSFNTDIFIQDTFRSFHIWYQFIFIFHCFYYNRQVSYLHAILIFLLKKYAHAIRLLFTIIYFRSIYLVCLQFLCIHSRRHLLQLQYFCKFVVVFCLQTSQSLFWTQRNLHPQLLKKNPLFFEYSSGRIRTRVTGFAAKHSTNELLSR